MPPLPAMLRGGPPLVGPPTLPNDDGLIQTFRPDGRFAGWRYGKKRFRYFDVADFATSGSGTQQDPWVGWTDGENICADEPTDNATYFFRSGHYAFDTLPPFQVERLGLVGEEGTVLHHTGDGAAIRLFPTNGNTENNGGSDGANWIFGGRVESILLSGNANTTDGFDCVGLRSWHFRNARVINVSEAGFRFRACVGNQLDNVGVTHRYNGDQEMSPQPLYGVYIDKRGTADWSTCLTFANLVTEGIRSGGYGIYIANQGAYDITLNGGTSEANEGKGLYVGNSAPNPTLTAFSFDLEANSQGNIEAVGGADATLIGCAALGGSTLVPGVKLTSTAKILQLGGTIHGVELGPASRYITLGGVTTGSGTAGQIGSTVAGYAFINSDARCTFVGSINTSHSAGSNLPEILGGGGYRTFAFASSTPSDTPNLQYRQFQKTLLQNWTVNAPAAGTISQGTELIFVVQQNATGGHVITWNAIFTGLGGGQIPRNSRSGNATDVFTFRFRSALQKWELVQWAIQDAPGGLYPVAVSSSETIALESGENSIPHGLGYTPKRVVVRALSAISVHEHSPPDATNLYLTASGPGNVKVHVA